MAQDGWADAISDRAAETLTKPTWEALFGKDRLKVNCAVIADLAKGLLDGSKRLHGFVGWACEHGVALFLSEPGVLVRVAAREIGRRVPLGPVDQAGAHAPCR